MEDCLSEVCGFEPVSVTFLFVAREISNLHHAAWRKSNSCDFNRFMFPCICVW